MAAINKSTGTTDSERYLALLADQSFLNLWSYPNPFIDKMVDGRGKELCDLLVVCDDHVIVFSDKTVEWPGHVDSELAWRRWYRRAVEKSVRQIRGAVRWIENYPERVFLDAQCNERLPIRLPSASSAKIHGIVVARGSGSACQEFFKGGLGSFMIDPKIKGPAHYKKNSVQPFVIGDPDPDGPYLHVLDDGSLDVVMRELDTITDLSQYLTKKEDLIRSGRLMMSTGEEDLVAYYMTHMESLNEHGFPRPDGKPLLPSEKLTIRDVYRDLRENSQYIARKKADEISYLWDNLIKEFTNHMLAGTSIVPDDEEFSFDLHEQGVREMALVPRYKRRTFSDGILSALKLGASEHRFVRSFIPQPDSDGAETGFFLMTLKIPEMEMDGGYGQYREVRRAMLETYAFSLLRKYQHLETVVGIGTEPLEAGGEKSKGSSEDLVLAKATGWSDDQLAELKKRQKLYDIMKVGNYREYKASGSEWPEVNEASAAGTNMNRKQRRALAARRRKQR